MKILEVIDHRILGALILVDNTTKTIISRPLKLSANGAKFIRNLSHHYVITHYMIKHDVISHDEINTEPINTEPINTEPINPEPINLEAITRARELESHTTEFESPPEKPAIASVTFPVTIEDPSGYYLARIVTVALPRDPDPESANQKTSLFQPIEVTMYNASTTPANSNWSIIRGSVFLRDEENHRIPVRGALVRVIRTDDETLLASGLTDTRGELTVIIPGIPMTNFSGEGGNNHGEADDNDDEPASVPVLTFETSVRLEVITDPELPWPVNPDTLEANRLIWLRNADQPILLTLKTGQTEKVEVALT